MLRKSLSLKNIHNQLIIRLLIILFLFSLSRLLFYIFNTELFPDTAAGELFSIMLAGLRFDISAIVIINIPFILLHILPLPGRRHRITQNIAEGLFYAVNAFALLTNTGDTVYYRFTLKRTTADIFQYLALDQGGDFFRLLPRYLLDFWYIILIWMLLVAAMVFLYRKTKKGYQIIENKLLHYIKHTILFGAFVLAFFILGRGGWQLRPISMISAGEYAGAQYIPLVLNTPFTIIQTINKQQIEPGNYFTSLEAAETIYSPLHHFHGHDSIKKINVAVIILESFSKEHMGSLNRGLEDGAYKGFTPFLDSLASEGLIFTNAFANGKRSIEGIPAVIAGFPNLMENPYITSAYAGNPVNGLPTLLRKYGYSSAFFHGGNNGTMRFDAFAGIAGFEKYYGRNEYGNDADYDSKWGIYDEPFLQFAAHKINDMPQPFCISVFTLSSHHPYQIPAEYRGTFRKGTLDIHESIQYTDFALKRFFETASAMPWFENTLFVLTADHSSPVFSTYYQNNPGALAIPVIYYQKGSELKGNSALLTQQTDILPSLLDYLGYSGQCVAFGHSVFDTTAPRYAVCYVNNLYQLIHNGWLLQFNGEKTLAAYDIRTDTLLQHNLAGEGAVRFALEEQFLKAIVQSYQTRMIENRMTTKPKILEPR
jgi:phosphoglycerol transferase MdoB-like AlkP superfamily enzyme